MKTACKSECHTFTFCGPSRNCYFGHVKHLYDDDDDSPRPTLVGTGNRLG